MQRSAAPLTSRYSSQTSGAVDEEAFRLAFSTVGKTPISVKNASDLQEKVIEIKEQLLSAPENWEIKAKCLQNLRCLVATNANRIDDFSLHLRPLEIPIQACINDLRSSVVKEVAITIAFLSQELGMKYERSIEIFFPSLLNLIPNSAKVMSTSALCCLRFILENVHSSKLLPHLLSTQASKSPILRKHCYDFMSFILSSWSKSSLEKHASQISGFLKKGISDADKEARSHSRSALFHYKTHFPKEYTNIIASLDVTEKKQLEGGGGGGGVGSSSGGGTGSLSNTTSRSNSREKLSSRPSSAASSSSSVVTPVAGEKPEIKRKIVSGIPPAPSSSSSSTSSSIIRPKSLKTIGNSRTGVVGKSAAGVNNSSSSSSSTTTTTSTKTSVSQKLLVKTVPESKRPPSHSTTSSSSSSSAAATKTRSLSSSNIKTETTTKATTSNLTTKAIANAYSNNNNNNNGKGIPSSVSGTLSRIPMSSSKTSINRSRQSSTESLNATSNTTTGGLIKIDNRLRNQSDDGCSSETTTGNIAEDSSVVNDDGLDDSRSTCSGFAATYAKWTTKSRPPTGGSEKCYPIRSAILPHNEGYWSWASVLRISKSARQSSSEASSEASSYASSSSRAGGIVCQNFENILSQLNSPMASERKRGLANLQRYIRSGQPLEPFQLRTIMDTLLKLFTDPESKILPLFMDAIQCTVKCYHYLLHEWLHGLLSRTMSKYASEVLQSNRKALQETLHVLRSNFPLELQFHVCCTCVLDLRQSCNTRLRACLLDYMKDLLLLLSPHVLECPSGDMRMAVMKVIAWTGDQKSGEIRRVASRMVVKLFDLNSIAFMTLVEGLPSCSQETAHRVIRKHLMACEQDVGAESPCIGQDINNSNSVVLMDADENNKMLTTVVGTGEISEDTIVRPSGLVSGMNRSARLHATQQAQSTINNNNRALPPSMMSRHRRRKTAPVYYSNSITSTNKTATTTNVSSGMTAGVGGVLGTGGIVGIGDTSDDRDNDDDDDDDDSETSLNVERATMGVNISLPGEDKFRRKRRPAAHHRHAQQTTKLHSNNVISAIPMSVGTAEKDNKSTDSGIQNSVTDLRAPLNLIINETAGLAKDSTVCQQPAIVVSDSNMLSTTTSNRHELILADILHELSNHNERNEQRRACLLRLIRMLNERCITHWEDHFKPTLLLLLETLSDKQSTLRALSLRVLNELLLLVPNLFYDYLHLTVIKILESFQDQERTVIHAAERCCRTLARTAPPEWSISVLVPIIHQSSPTLTLAALHFERQVVRASPPALVEIFLPEISPDLVELCYHQESAVRKECVFCLVAVYFKVSDLLWPFVKGLNNGKIRLLKFYIEKQEKGMDGRLSSRITTASASTTSEVSPRLVPDPSVYS